MREVMVKVYKFNELSDKAKEKAIAWYRECMDYPWTRENKDAFDEFADHFGLKGLEGSYDTYRGDCRARHFPNNAEEISGLRLYSWLNYHHFDYLFPYDYVGKARKYSKVRRSRACPTGYCISESMLDPIYEFLEKPYDITLAALLQKCLDKWASDCSDDMEYYYSAENLSIEIDANEWEFAEDGKAY